MGSERQARIWQCGQLLRWKLVTLVRSVIRGRAQPSPAQPGKCDQEVSKGGSIFDGGAREPHELALCLSTTLTAISCLITGRKAWSFGTLQASARISLATFYGALQKSLSVSGCNFRILYASGVVARSGLVFPLGPWVIMVRAAPGAKLEGFLVSYFLHEDGTIFNRQRRTLHFSGLGAFLAFSPSHHGLARDNLTSLTLPVQKN